MAASYDEGAEPAAEPGSLEALLPVFTEASFFGLIGYTEWERAEIPANALADGGYFEVGYANALEWEGKELFDYSISYLYSEADNLTANQARNNLIFGITKKFGIYD